MSLFILALLFATTYGDEFTQILVDPKNGAEMFDGIGGLSAGASSRLLYDYPEPTRSHILDLLFLPNFAASFHILKVEIGGDSQSTWGTEPSHMHSRDDENYQRGYEWWLMTEAKKRNPNIRIYCLAWGEPHWIGNGTFFSDDGISYHVKFIQGAKRYYNVTVDYLGIWNEMPWNGDYIKKLRKGLDANGLNHVQIVAADGDWSIAEAMAKDEELNASVSIVGVHSSAQPPDVVSTLHKPLWRSEDGGIDSAPPSWPSAMTWARHLITYYVKNRQTSVILCPLITSWIQNFRRVNHGLIAARHPWSGYYEVRRSFIVTAHFTHFIQPGWLYLPPLSPTTRINGQMPGSGILEGGVGSFTTLVPNKTSSDFVIIIETSGATTITNVVAFFPLITKVLFVAVWQTNETFSFVDRPIVPIVSGRFIYTLDPQSVYTFTNTNGGGGHSYSVPSPAPLPTLPYSDDFDGDDRAEYQNPRYLSDYFGSFQIHAPNESSPSSNRVLRQWVTAQPIDWHRKNGEPIAYFPGNWQNYRVQCDALIESPTGAKNETCGTVKLCGRADLVESGLTWNNSIPVGLCLIVDCSGNWNLTFRSTKSKHNGEVLRRGTVSKYGPNQWHTLALELFDYRVTALIDNVTITQTTDGYLYATNGMAGIGSGWNFAQFDNFLISTNRTQQAPRTSLLFGLLPDGGSYYRLRGMFGVCIKMKKNVTLTAVGRYFAPFNRHVHEILILDAHTERSLLDKPISLDMSQGEADVLGFKYANVSSDVELVAHHSYYIVLSESDGGDDDEWFDTNHSGHESTGDGYHLLTLMDVQRDVVEVVGRVQSSSQTNSSYQLKNDTNTAYGPLNILFKETV
ncbi:galactocerebrosidase-like [Oscarella lobularis]|uniref:galactocerebrosidase-like n=1 Tax=Oscarella lobularis TaxID=121494 RepID=UPI0033136FED